ncbi:hypothetical protein ASE08_11715 [Rhizobacter sp. Root16D2]|nr:hypothetical protein ASC88_15435 [Rhizobacter sp. Root29]KQW04471.1 hypothetical protein ASC98_05125 [Rhizobacter sp. Root1238]KRB06319.1 hypothetical protein ASE08_11715 [Rhizobacter sp. Root16D2]
MLRELVERLRHAGALQVGRRADDDPPVRCQPARDDVRIARRPQPHRGVEAGGPQVGQLLAEVELHLHLRVRRMELRQQRPEPRMAEAERAAQPDQAARLVVALGQLRLQLLEALQQRPRLRHEGLAVRRELQPARAAVEQPQPEPRLQRRQPLRHRRRRQVELACRGGQAAQLGRAAHQQQVGALDH